MVKNKSMATGLVTANPLRDLRKAPSLQRNQSKHNASINSRFFNPRPKNKMRGVSSEVGSVAYEDDNDDGVPEVDEVESIDTKAFKSVQVY